MEGFNIANKKRAYQQDNMHKVCRIKKDEKSASKNHTSDLYWSATMYRGTGNRFFMII